MVDVSFDYTTDGGVTYQPCAAAPSSPLGNPALGVSLGVNTFIRSSRTDGIGLMAPESGVVVRVIVDDQEAPGTCSTLPFDVDNTSLCFGTCGDCNQDGMGPSILDALIAAQIDLGLISRTQSQSACCDVDSSGVVDVLDALLIGQVAVQLQVTLVCF